MSIYLENLSFISNHLFLIISINVNIQKISIKLNDKNKNNFNFKLPSFLKFISMFIFKVLTVLYKESNLKASSWTENEKCSRTL